MLPSEFRVTTQSSCLDILGPVQLTQGGCKQEGGIVHEGRLRLVNIICYSSVQDALFIVTSHYLIYKKLKIYQREKNITDSYKKTLYCLLTRIAKGSNVELESFDGDENSKI